MTTIARALALLLAVSPALPARAAPVDDAKKAFSEGKSAFERGDYEAALASYQRANMILPAPNLYYNIGATYERLGRYQEAALAFDKYFEMAGAATSDDERAFQEKLHARADADRRRADLPPTPQPQRAAPQPQAPPATAQPYPAQPYPAQPYWMAPQQPPRDVRLQEAKGRRRRAIALMAVGVPMSAVGIGLGAYGYSGGSTDSATNIAYAFVGTTLFVVGVTLWAPGAASFVRSSHDVRELSKPEPLPPTTRGF